MEELVMHTDIHVFGTNYADSRSRSDIMRRYALPGQNVTLVDLDSAIGVREIPYRCLIPGGLPGRSDRRHQRETC